jgi:nicotinamide-nucleotide amidase
LKAETVSIGTELLLGEIVDTNAAYISQRLAAIGVDVYFRHTVGDNLGRILQVLQGAMRRCDVVIICGGLGPTQDDLTREAVAEFTGRPLQRVPAAEKQLREFFAKRGLTPTENNLKQCMVPRGGTLLDNSCGTAPGLFVEYEGMLVFAIPGPPTEMRAMMESGVLPFLRERVRFEQGGVLYSRMLRLCDIGESAVATELEDLIGAQSDPTIALYAAPAEVKIRIATKDTDEADAQERLGALETLIRARLGRHVYGVDDETMEVAVGKALRISGGTLAIAESCTGGMLANRITDVPGASQYFLSGYVTYSNEAKTQLLGVSDDLLARHGAVSEECARAMAEGARGVSGASLAVATTGIAGPSGGSPEKPVGTVYIAVTDGTATVVRHFCWPGTREQFKARVTQMALNMLRKMIIGELE